MELQAADVFDRAFTHYAISRLLSLMAEAAAGSGLALDLSIKTTTEVTRETKNDNGSATSCHSQGLTIFGYHIVGWESCHTVSEAALAT